MNRQVGRWGESRVQAESSEVVRHFALGDWIWVLPGELRELVAQVSIGEAARH